MTEDDRVSAPSEGRPWLTWRRWWSIVMSLGVATFVVTLLWGGDLGDAVGRAASLSVGLGLALAIMSQLRDFGE